MKRFLTRTITVCALMVVVLFAHIEAGLSHVWPHHHHCQWCYAHAAYVEPIPYYGVCRVGWWQTLRYGHVSPRWGAWCRR